MASVAIPVGCLNWPGSVPSVPHIAWNVPVELNRWTRFRRESTT